MFVIKNGHPHSWVKWTSMQDSAIQNSRWKIHAVMSASSLCSLTKTYLPWPHRKTHRMTDCAHIRQPTRKMSRQKDRTNNTLTLSHWWHRRRFSTPVWHLSISESRLVRSINRNVMLLQQFLSSIRQISSECFIFQQDSAPAHRGLEAINSPIVSPSHHM